MQGTVLSLSSGTSLSGFYKKYENKSRCASKSKNDIID